MRNHILFVAFVSFASLRADQKPQSVITFRPGEVVASLDSRREWVVEQKRINRHEFDAKYGWIVKAPAVTEMFLQQIAYLYFYSTGLMCGFLDNPERHGDFWSFRVHDGLPPGTSGKPILVDPKGGLVWQEGQTEKIDYVSLIKTGDANGVLPNHVPDPTSPSVTPPAGAGGAPSVGADH
jgi:hypothetical protein